eukprot:15340047-Ditylum_brightwellii.AAC.4
MEEQCMIPITLLLANTIQRCEIRKLMKVLLDSGGSGFMIHDSYIHSSTKVSLADLILPEFDKTKQVDCIQANVFDAAYNYGMICGRDFLQHAGINLSFKFGYVEWMGQCIAMWLATDGVNSMTIEKYLHLLDDEMEE